MFSPAQPKRDEMPTKVWTIAGVIVLAVAALVLALGHHKPAAAANSSLPLDPYAANLPLSQLAMSESTSLSGGKSTFVDGHIQNTGGHTVTGIIVQTIFHNEEATPPQVETLPLTLIRTHEPYVDTEAVSAAPVGPESEREFRLIFETIPANWNTQMPEIRIIHVTTK